ncbi:hypothetical protein E2C01_101430 [Portunus trituberculatus]|uniref:Uncharacterized protein n=1 Tax=Portunus trituberculatus TaxID=210409 RepID=A0A5B7K5P2_PORTR|nr:hypothetical protein [Portunus trituberculatus]
MVAPVVSFHPFVTPSVYDRASCDEYGLSMETSDDIVSQPSLVEPLYQKVQSCLILVLRGPVQVMMVRITHR